VRIFCFPSILIPVFPFSRNGELSLSLLIPAQKPILHKNLSGLGIGLPMKIATDDF
jgi:hypothetical protein